METVRQDTTSWISFTAEWSSLLSTCRQHTAATRIGRSPRYLLCLLPNLVSHPQRHRTLAHLGGGLGRLAQSCAEMVSMEEVKLPQTHTHTDLHTEGESVSFLLLRVAAPSGFCSGRDPTGGSTRHIFTEQDRHLLCSSSLSHVRLDQVEFFKSGAVNYQPH